MTKKFNSSSGMITKTTRKREMVQLGYRYKNVPQRL